LLGRQVACGFVHSLIIARADCPID
jgi:hypothetical protein